jgi:AcrR family transcriptional regulator
MVKKQERFAEMREQSLEKIRSAAIECFSEKGFAGTSMDDIAACAGVSKGLVYRHFPSKELLFSSLIDSAAQGNRDMTELMRTDADPKETLLAIAENIHHYMSESADFTRLMMLVTQCLMNRSVANWEELVELDRETMRAGAAQIARGQALGEFCEGNPMQMIIQFFSNIQGLVMLKFALDQSFEMPAVEMLTAHLFYKGNGDDRDGCNN